jgi:wobble nucleotide-excising tRNase
VEVPDKAEGEGLVAAANTFVAQHNAETGNFTSGIASARKRLEECLVAETTDTFRMKVAAFSACEHAKKAIGTKGTELAEQVAGLEREVVEHRRPAEELNEELTSYLGRSELRFEVKENGYSILRDAFPARHLSEGERTAIAFLYFLKSLQAKDFDLKKDIVVIDDPVSSLDTNSLFCAFGFMKERTREAGQLFVMTHNATFFRQVKNWFNHVNGRNRKTYPEHCRARFFMVSTTLDGVGNRTASLTALDKLLHKYESDYHYLFDQIHLHAQHLGNTSPLDQFYGLPNIARRLLEAFLAFRYPSLPGDLGKQLDSVKFDAAKKSRILRFLHTFSHEGKIAEGDHDLSILAETPQVLTDLLDLIKSEDERHFNEMNILVSPQTN